MNTADLTVAAFRIGRWLLALLLFIWFLGG
jgi:hypothetical protein